MHKFPTKRFAAPENISPRSPRCEKPSDGQGSTRFRRKREHSRKISEVGEVTRHSPRRALYTGSPLPAGYGIALTHPGKARRINTLPAECRKPCPVKASGLFRQDHARPSRSFPRACILRPHKNPPAGSRSRDGFFDVFLYARPFACAIFQRTHGSARHGFRRRALPPPPLSPRRYIPPARPRPGRPRPKLPHSGAASPACPRG